MRKKNMISLALVVLIVFSISVCAFAEVSADGICKHSSYTDYYSYTQFKTMNGLQCYRHWYNRTCDKCGSVFAHVAQPWVCQP